MTFRRRIVLLAAAAVALAIAGAVSITYIIVRHDLRAGVDAALRATNPQFTFIRAQGKAGQDEGTSASAPAPAQDQGGARVKGDPSERDTRVQIPNQAFGGATGVAQATLITGQTILPDTPAVLPVTKAVVDVAAGRRAAFLRDESVGDVHLRVLTRRGPGGE